MSAMAAPQLRWSGLIRGAGLAARWDGPEDPIITSVAEDSRQVKPGACFVAMRGLQADGHAFVGHALQAGAVAVISEQPVTVPAPVPTLTVESARGLAGRLAASLFGLDTAQREGRLKVVGITGTNGKSTFCYLLRRILQAAGRPSAMLGTIEYDLLCRRVDAAMTTPPASKLMAYLAEAVEAGATHAIMEVSSHALDQDRCAGIRFAVGVFSNLTGDHLDYHQTMPSYLAAKKKLFDGLDEAAVAVVNEDDDFCEDMIAGCRAFVMRYGVAASDADSAGADEAAGPDIRARIRNMTAAGTRFDLIVRSARTGQGRPVCESGEIASPLIGKHNVRNCLAAAGAAVALGIPLETIVAGLESIGCIPGRLERVEVPGDKGQGGGDPGFTVLVDYAHTDDALKNVLSALKPLTRRAGSRLIVLFGCGGDRDRMKRPRMARAAGRLADCIVVTSDNPRTEDPGRIIDDIMAGFEPGALPRVQVQADRKQAIGAAIAMARTGDIVLLAGKGHETYQEVGRERVPFDDARIAAGLLADLTHPLPER